jgi:ABC-type nitrate/sulfonate/bicarbonate transport system substrate-binding protein
MVQEALGLVRKDEKEAAAILSTIKAYPPLSDTEAVEMQLYLGLSVKQMDKLRHLMQHWKRPGFIPSHNTRYNN